MSRAYIVDAATGSVFGRGGKKVGRIGMRGYVEIHAGGGTYLKAHRVIWEAINGPIAAGMQINHINGIKHDNRLENLELVTSSENLRHAYRLGLADARGDRNGRAIGKIRSTAARSAA